MMTWVSVSATALSIFLVMAFFMASHIKTVEMAPESDRGRIMTGIMMDLHSTDPQKGWSMSAGLDYETAVKFYAGLEGTEKHTYFTFWPTTYNVGLKKGKTFPMSARFTDEAYWKLYDFKFLYGKPYDEAACNAGEKKVVVSRSVARKLFQEDDVVGREIMVSFVPYTICGVVEDVHPMLSSTSNDMFIPLRPEDKVSSERHNGNIGVQFRLKPGVREEAVQKEVESRYKAFNKEIAKDFAEMIYHGQPYSLEVMSLEMYGNITPDLAAHRRTNYFVYTFLLLLPAINLSAMTRARLRHRISEIGVRRAFGARRLSIVGQILVENFLITLVGGVIGLVISFIFMLALSDMFLNYTTQSWLATDVRPGLNMLFSWQAFAFALAFCFILNILSASLPAFSASRQSPAVAISKSKQ